MHTNICLNSSALEGQGGLGILPRSGHWAQRGEVPFWYASSLARISWPWLPDIFRFVLVPFVHLLHLMHDASSEIEFPCPTLRSSNQGYQPEWFNWFRGVPEALSSFQSQVKKSCFFDPIWTKHYCFLQKTFGAFGHGQGTDAFDCKAVPRTVQSLQSILHSKHTVHSFCLLSRCKAIDMLVVTRETRLAFEQLSGQMRRFQVGRSKHPRSHDSQGTAEAISAISNLRKNKWSNIGVPVSLCFSSPLFAFFLPHISIIHEYHESYWASGTAVSLDRPSFHSSLRNCWCIDSQFQIEHDRRLFFMALGGSDATCWIEWIANEKILLHTFCSVKLPWPLHFYPLQSSHVFGMKNGKFDISGAKRFIPTNTLKPWLFSLPKEAPARPRHQRWRAKLQKKTEGWRITKHRHMLYAAYALYRYYIYIHLYTIHSTWVYGWMGEWDCLMGTFIIEYWISNQIVSNQIIEFVAKLQWIRTAARKRLGSGASMRICAAERGSAQRPETGERDEAIRRFVNTDISISCIRFLYYVYMRLYIHERDVFSFKSADMLLPYSTVL